MNYWPFQVTGNAGSILWKYKKLKDKDKFKDILQNLHFSNNTETVKNDNAEKGIPRLQHLTNNFLSFYKITALEIYMK